MCNILDMEKRKLLKNHTHSLAHYPSRVLYGQFSLFFLPLLLVVLMYASNNLAFCRFIFHMNGHEWYAWWCVIEAECVWCLFFCRAPATNADAFCYCLCCWWWTSHERRGMKNNERRIIRNISENGHMNNPLEEPTAIMNERKHER